jgi:hypothetical protein
MSNIQRLARLAAILVLTLVFVWLFSGTTATATQRLVVCSPVPIPKETLTIEPVTSPTTLLTQTLRVRLNNGRRVTVTSEAGMTIFTIMSASTFVSPIPLLPNVTHHIVVTGQVEYQPGCYYTTQSSTVDKNNAPLKIIQLGRRILLPIILKH